MKEKQRDHFETAKSSVGLWRIVYTGDDYIVLERTMSDLKTAESIARIGLSLNPFVKPVNVTNRVSLEWCD